MDEIIASFLKSACVPAKKGNGTIFWNKNKRKTTHVIQYLKYEHTLSNIVNCNTANKEQV